MTGAWVESVPFGRRFLGRCTRWMKHCLLVIETVGLEASNAIEVIFMITNIQTLGVPIRYSSLPGTVSAAIGMVLIPSLGFIMDRWAKSKSAKALILIGTSSLEMLGTLFIFSANTIKLLYYDDPEIFNSSFTTTWPNTTQSAMSTTSPELMFTTNNLTSSSHPSISNTNTTLGSILLDETRGVGDITPVKILDLEPKFEKTIHYYTILAMVGYCLLDCGYDSSLCSVKTFTLASTNSKDHSSVIVKSVFVSSFGGLLIAVLGSVGLGYLLTAGTHHDGNAAQSAFVAGLCFILLLTGLFTTLTTGFCCSLSSDAEWDESLESSKTKPAGEKSQILESANASGDLAYSSRNNSQTTPKNYIKNSKSEYAETAESKVKTTESKIIDNAVLPPRTGLIGFALRQKKQILVNLFTFFMVGSLHSFEVYSVNFVADGIFQGNPLAPVGSEAYQNYLHGIEVGSQGTLIYYLTFLVCTSIHEILLTKLGWKREVVAASAVYVVVNLVCAKTSSIWAYYVTAMWTGIFHTVIVTVPYILANKFALEEGNGKDSGVAIAMVAAMLPCGFIVCSALMGPLIDATGNPATPIYYSSVTAALGIIVSLFLKSE